MSTKFATKLSFVWGAALLCAGSMMAQEGIRPTFSVSGGWIEPVGSTGRHVDRGWNIGAGGGLNFNNVVGTTIDLGYNSMGLNSATLTNAGFPGGSFTDFSAAINPIVHLTPGQHADFYLVGGVGLHHITTQFTQPSVSPFVGFDPFFGFYTALRPTTDILASYSVNKPGIDFGAGVAFGTKFHGKFFAEARYNRVFMTGERHVDYLPVSFGFRW